MRVIVKRCACGAEYTQEEWDTLPLVGHYSDDVVDLELRNCPCGSTIAIDRRAQ